MLNCAKRMNMYIRHMLSKKVYDIRQLVGYDAAGNEVYEGDTVILEGKDYKVSYCFCYGAFKNFKKCRKK